jgi:hypothetical protein
VRARSFPRDLAIIVTSVAVLVGVFLGLPMLLTDEGVHVDANLVVNAFTAFATGVAAVGTVGTLAWAVLNGLQLRSQADADRRRAEANREADQKRADAIREAETAEKMLSRRAR